MTRGANVASQVTTDTPLIVSGGELDFKRIKGVYVQGYQLCDRSRAELAIQDPTLACTDVSFTKNSSKVLNDRTESGSGKYILHLTLDSLG